MKKLRPELTNKLKMYSAMATTVFATGAVNGQIVYTDIEPDVIFDSSGDAYFLDLNDDGITDFLLYMATNTNPGVFMGIIPYVSGVGSVAASTGSSVYIYPLVQNAGDIISAGLPWEGYNGPVFQSMLSLYYAFAGTYGNWMDVSDGYLGLRLNVGVVTTYGWARLDASADGFTFTLKDFAYNSALGASICAGDSVGPSDCVNAISAVTWVGNLDIGNAGNGTDLGFSFNASSSEDAVTEYRAVAVKSAAAGSFDLAAAQTLTSDQYVVITPTGAPLYNAAFGATTQDSDGDLIANDVPYILFVLAGSTDYTPALSDGSGEITLTDVQIAIETIDAISQVNILPNPATDYLTIDLSGIHSDITIEVFDMIGNHIQNLSFVSGDVLTTDVSQLPAGNYLIRISDGQVNKTLKFIKQ
ncbi:MAG: T9SS type A sorting domain-containing protein [Chitinophagales bacterium]